MGNVKLIGGIACTWPARFGSWAEPSPDCQSLCRSLRAVSWRLRPPTLQEVREVVDAAFRNRTPLWPVSRGCNWGYGSHLPAREGTVILDLSQLDAISDLDRASLSIRIEPGVSQDALHNYLRRNAPDLALNVTGSGKDTSVLGNALDRGTGYSGEKDRDVYALEVLLADGSLVGPVEGRNHKSRAHPAGLSTDGLFFQSNLGVVVGARLRLRIRQEAEYAVILKGPFEGLISTLKSAYDHQLLVNPTHLAEPGRSQRLGFGLLRMLWRREPTLEEVSRCFPEQKSHNGLVPLYGRRRVASAAWSELRRLAAPGVQLQRAGPGTLDFAVKWLARLGARSRATRLQALRPLLALAWGEPSDVGLASLDGYAGGNPDLAKRGAVYGNAVSSVEAAEARRAAGIVRKYWKDCAFTWIVLDSRCMLTIYTLHFDGDAGDAVRQANRMIVEELRRAGLPSYRLDVNLAAAAGGQDLHQRIKQAFDPFGIISPGRYEA